MECFLGFLPVLCLTEDVSQGAKQSIRRLHLGLNLEKQAHLTLLEVSPVIGIFHQRVSHMCEQVGLRLSITEFMGLKLLVLALGRTAYALAAPALLDGGLQEVFADKTLKIGEKLSFRRFERVAGDEVATYIHGGGKIGVLVAATGANGDAVKEALTTGGCVGKRLDFLAQELNREANTTLSKSTDIEISNVAITIKTEIEKIREQIQNIE